MSHIGHISASIPRVPQFHKRGKLSCNLVGRRSRPSVVSGNLMVSRAIGPGNGCSGAWFIVGHGHLMRVFPFGGTVFRRTKMTLILYAARFHGIHWLLENPSQSLVWDLKFIFQFFMQLSLACLSLWCGVRR